MIKLDLVQTVAFAGIVLFIGYGIKRLIPVLTRYNIPAPIVGGLLVSIVVVLARQADMKLVEFNTTLQTPLMIAFFTTIGFGASLSLLRTGGPLVLIFFLASTVLAVAQNVLGAGIALLLGRHPLLGVLAGSVALTGGPATGLAFGPDFEAIGVAGASTVAIAAAMVGIISGGLIGGPVGTFLIERHKLGHVRAKIRRRPAPLATNIVEDQLPEPKTAVPEGEDIESYSLLKSLVVILVAMWIGSWVSDWFTAQQIKLPAYIGAMLVAGAIRNLDDLTGIVGVSQRVIDDLGTVALSLFLVMALMTLRLWELAGLAVPLIVILAWQVVLIAVVSLFVIYRLMGRDYEAAVMSSGFCGFMLGTTANAMANMEALVERYGHAPKAFLVVPTVGAFLIDFTNALIITAFLNFWR